MSFLDIIALMLKAMSLAYEALTQTVFFGLQLWIWLAIMWPLIGFCCMRFAWYVHEQELTPEQKRKFALGLLLGWLTFFWTVNAAIYLIIEAFLNKKPVAIAVKILTFIPRMIYRLLKAAVKLLVTLISNGLEKTGGLLHR